MEIYTVQPRVVTGAWLCTEQVLTIQHADIPGFDHFHGNESVLTGVVKEANQRAHIN